MSIENFIDGSYPAIQNSWNEAIDSLCNVLMLMKKTTSTRWGYPEEFSKIYYYSYLQRRMQRYILALERKGILTDAQRAHLFNFLTSLKHEISSLTSFVLSLPTLHHEDVIIDKSGHSFLIDMNQTIFCDEAWDVANLLFRYADGNDEKINYITQRFIIDDIVPDCWSTLGRLHLLLFHLGALSLVANQRFASDKPIVDSIKLHLSALLQSISDSSDADQ
jgi:hypothetical protein